MVIHLTNASKLNMSHAQLTWMSIFNLMAAIIITGQWHLQLVE